MRNLILMFFCLLIALGSFAQTSSKEYNKDIALYKAKEYLIKNILEDDTNESVKFTIDALSSASSGNLTSLVYSCKQKNKKGLLLGFFSDVWNPQGVIYNQYSFKNIPEIKAKELIQLIDVNIEENKGFLGNDINNNNFYFEFEDLLFLIYKTNGATKIRIFGVDYYDALWDFNSFYKTKKRFLKKI